MRSAWLIAASMVALLYGLPASGAAWQDNCRYAAELAKTVMVRRQQGADMAKIMDLANSTDDKQVTALATDIVLAAYKQPRFQTDEAQQRAVDDFGNSTYLLCVETLRK